jgi:hypothetical protein
MTSSPPTVQPTGLFARIVGVITAPRATFENVVAAPRPVGVLFISALLIGVATTLPPMLNEDLLRSSVEGQMKMAERFGQPPASPEAFEEAVARSKRWLVLGPVGALISTPIISLIFTAVYWVAFNAVLGGTASFKQVLAIVTHSQVIGALGVVAAAPIQYAQGRMTLTGPFTLGPLLTFLPEDNFVRTLLGTTSVFTIWSLIVTAIGLSVLYRRKTRNIAIALLLAYFAIAAALVSVFGGMTGTGR